MSYARRLIKELETSITMFENTNSIPRLHFLSRFVKKCDFEQVLEAQDCLISPWFLNEKDFENFLAARNAFFCTGLRYRSEYVNCFLPTYVTATGIQTKIVRFEDLEQVPCETKV